MSSIEPDDGSGEIDSTKEGLGALVVSCGDASELFEFREGIRDQIPGLVHLLIISPLFFSVFLGRDDGPERRPFPADREPVPARHKPCRPGTPQCFQEDRATGHRLLPDREPVPV